MVCIYIYILYYLKWICKIWGNPGWGWVPRRGLSGWKVVLSFPLNHYLTYPGLLRQLQALGSGELPPEAEWRMRELYTASSWALQAVTPFSYPSAALHGLQRTCWRSSWAPISMVLEMVWWGLIPGHRSDTVQQTADCVAFSMHLSLFFMTRWDLQAVRSASILSCIYIYITHTHIYIISAYCVCHINLPPHLTWFLPSFDYEQSALPNPLQEPQGVYKRALILV